MKQVGIQYVGKKPEHVDTLYGTNLRFEPEQSHAVPEDVAKKMLAHTDTYAEAALPQGDLLPNPSNDAAESKQRIQEDDDRHNAPPLVDLNGLDKKGLQNYALQHYNEKLPATMKETTMRDRIAAFANRK